MRILLVGEYSNLHNSLKAGLMLNGHEVLLLGSGDAFKKLPVDIDISAVYFNKIRLFHFVRKVFFTLFRFDLSSFETAQRAKRAIGDLPDYDIIQLINEYPFKTPYFLERKLIKKLRQKTKKLVVLACGDDYIYLKNIDKLPHHPMRSTGKNFPYSNLYLTKKHRRFHDFVFSLKNQVISTDFDYHTIYKNTGLAHYYGLIPNPVNIDKFRVIPSDLSDKTVIFHGINRTNYYKKGNDFFEAALEIILKKYPDQVEILTVESLPYSEYIKQYDRAHILLDQAYALDQGYNALEAMAKGKVVLTGAGKDFCAFYDLEQDTVAIHTIPEVDQIVANLESLINKPERIRQISEGARRFIEQHHDYKEIAQRYVAAWQTI